MDFFCFHSRINNVGMLLLQLLIYLYVFKDSRRHHFDTTFETHMRMGTTTPVFDFRTCVLSKGEYGR